MRMRNMCLIVAVLAILLSWSAWHYEFGTEHWATFKVSSLEDQNSGSKHKYLAFATNAGGQLVVYENTDAYLHGKANSSDVQVWLGQHLHQWLRCDVYGWRNHIMSSYQDILHCNLLHSPAVHS